MKLHQKFCSNFLGQLEITQTVFSRKMQENWRTLLGNFDIRIWLQLHPRSAIAAQVEDLQYHL